LSLIPNPEVDVPVFAEQGEAGWVSLSLRSFARVGVPFLLPEWVSLSFVRFCGK